MDMSLSKLWKIVKEREAWHAAVHGVAKNGHILVTEQQAIHKFFKAETLNCIFLFPLDMSLIHSKM